MSIGRQPSFKELQREHEFQWHLERHRYLEHQRMFGTSRPMKSRAVTLWLSVLLGWLGADRFYLRHKGLAVLKLLTLGDAAFGGWSTSS